MEQTTQRTPFITYVGLALALFGVPLLIFYFQTSAPPGPFTDRFVLTKELSIFALTGVLLLLIIKGEKLGLDSIGLHNRNWGKSVLWGFIGALIAFAALAILLLIFSQFGIKFGEGEEGARYKNVSLWVITIMVLRAGIVEEVCYRGYVIERLEKMTGNWIVYFLIPLILFAVFHYRQGTPGVIIAFVAGAILAVLYLKRRDLKANIITHFIVDFVPNVLIPLFAK
ncbi:MAG TPA: type II CAAX endopeptidase family protein [Acidobacteriota bacterium]|nr:type II CAAX endopeptidase family protein [Acidobacteriota bacterium]